ncbi:MAG: magnesium chelatase [Ignavibacteriae bacterium]|nr:magnesium chelatase [Ignavibacteriota bacterium]
MKHHIQTFGQLKESGYELLPVKEEMRRNLITKLKNKEPLFPGIIGFEDTVIPQLVNALLAKHDILLLGLRGQAKTRIARLLIELLDEYTPVVKGTELHDSPLAPISKFASDIIAEYGDATPIEWVHRSERYGEKLATPDVTIADLIGDIDPIKAATQRLHYSHEGAIHFGIIPRTNRGIFVVNELPDLQPRIQVGLFNLLQERDIQIRGFNVRIPLDICLVFTANPEDYTHRGSIITPLKDRIGSQILTHYPRSLEDGIHITSQEAWVKRSESTTIIPHYFRQIIESIAFIARGSEFIDQTSGVSARLTISVMEALISNAERRSLLIGEKYIAPRMVDLTQSVTGITGKVELVFEGEQEGAFKVARALIGKAVREVFSLYFPDPLARSKRAEQKQKNVDVYQDIIRFFEQGNSVTINDTMNFDSYFKELNNVPGLQELAVKYIQPDSNNEYETAVAMEFLLDGLHQNSKIAKDEYAAGSTYKDMIGSIFTRPTRTHNDDDGEGY